MVNNNMETSPANNAEESKIQDRDVCVISKDKAEKQQMILNRQQAHTEVYLHWMNTKDACAILFLSTKTLYYCDY